MQETYPPALHITYYTDPLDAWSWAFEPVWRRLRWEFGGAIGWRYRMTGLIADWQRFDDPLNAVSRPAQMGPYWLQVRHTTGMPLDELVWVEDPPGSSYPAALAVKAAERQGAAAGEAYLRRVRRAALLEGRNVACRDVLAALAADLATRLDPAAWNAGRFCDDLDGDAARDAFREDLKDAGYRGVGRAPTLILRRPDGRASMIVGYRPYPALMEAVRYLAPDLAPAQAGADPVAYVNYWGDALAGEVALAASLSEAEARAALDAAVDARRLVRTETRPGAVYVPSPGVGETLQKTWP